MKKLNRQETKSMARTPAPGQKLINVFRTQGKAPYITVK
jgi:hypothetical protein